MSPGRRAAQADRPRAAWGEQSLLDTVKPDASLVFQTLAGMLDKKDQAILDSELAS